MSEENVEIVRAHFEATNSGDFVQAAAMYADDVELVVSDDLADHGTYSGRDAVGRWFGDWFNQFRPGYTFEIRELLEVGTDRVVVVGRHYGAGRASGAAVEAELANAYEIRDEKIARVWLYRSRAEALEAVGLSE
jgi:ketosteroid isomerase-like protein